LNDKLSTNVNSYRHFKINSDISLKRGMDVKDQGGNKRARMFDTSTPIQYRQQQWDTQVSTGNELTQNSIDPDSTTDSSSGEAGQGRTNLSRGTENVVLDTDKPIETPTQNYYGFV